MLKCNLDQVSIATSLCCVNTGCLLDGELIGWSCCITNSINSCLLIDWVKSATVRWDGGV